MDILLIQKSPIPFHSITAFFAILIGGVQFILPKGGTVHKIIGYIWLILMLNVAFSSFFINEIQIWGAYSPIHFLSIFTILSLFLAIYFVRIGNIRRHKQVMILLYVFGLIITGLFTLYPGRIMHQIFFS